MMEMVTLVAIIMIIVTVTFIGIAMVIVIVIDIVCVVEHEGNGDLCCGVRGPGEHPLSTIVVPFDHNVVFSLIAIELSLELFPNMTASFRFLLQGKNTTWMKPN